MNFDLVLRNGTIITMDPALSRQRWLAVKEGKIAAVGDRDDFSGEAGEVVDLAGRTVLPGLIETHCHSCMSAISWAGVELSGAEDSRAVLQAVEEFCKDKTEGTLVCGSNMRMPVQMTDGRIPNRYELDEVSNGCTVILVLWTAHGGVVNSRGVAQARLTEEMKAEVEPQGFFNEDSTSFHVIGNLYDMITDQEFAEQFHGVARTAASRGITTLHSLDGMMVRNDRDTDVLMRILDELPIEFVNYTQTFDWKKIQAYGLKQIGGCLSVDGSPPQLTAAYQEPYPTAPHTRGFLSYTDKELYEFVTAAAKAGMQIAFHAIGDRAIDQILHIYQQVDREIGLKELRCRIEHFSLPSERHIEMAAELNVVATTQPAIGNMIDQGEGGNGYEAFASREKAALHENFARVMQGGVVVAGGSDSPVTPLDAFFGMDAAVNAHNPQRRVSLTDALRLYTVNAAWAARQEKAKGSLEVGKQADLVVIDKDPYKIKGCIDRSVIRVEATYRKGAQIYHR